MAGIENVRRPQTTRVLSVEERARRARIARLRQYDRALNDLFQEPDEWMHGLVPDRPEADIDEEDLCP